VLIIWQLGGVHHRRRKQASLIPATTPEIYHHERNKKGVLGALTSGQTGFSKTRKTLDFSSRVTSKNCDAACVLFALA
jgi:hypothetical protein